jgi:hypothetical protein
MIFFDFAKGDEYVDTIIDSPPDCLLLLLFDAIFIEFLFGFGIEVR